jgi:hypothetical protein
MKNSIFLKEDYELSDRKLIPIDDITDDIFKNFEYNDI